VGDVNDVAQRAGVAGRVALVTGAASGIGRATAALLARLGARVAVTDVRVTGAEEVAEGIRANGGEAHGYALDVADENSWRSSLATLQARWGALHILVNSAGISRASPLTATSLDEWRLVFAVNVEGVFLGLRHGIPAIRGAGGGSIVTVASASGVKPAPGAAAYCASKAAVCMLSRTAALECAASGDPIRINTVLPAGVRTPMWQEMAFFQQLVEQQGSEEAAWNALGADGPARRFATPEEVAQAIVFLCSDAASYINATDLAVDYGFTA
jgi:NAD(P)-dependent dehydrogenase (short-subunit alcohol dehydrogenase family)